LPFPGSSFFTTGNRPQTIARPICSSLPFLFDLPVSSFRLVLLRRKRLPCVFSAVAALFPSLQKLPAESLAVSPPVSPFHRFPQRCLVVAALVVATLTSRRGRSLFPSRPLRKADTCGGQHLGFSPPPTSLSLVPPPPFDLAQGQGSYV